MYSHILVPLAPDHPDTGALDAARRLLAPGGRIHVLCVLEPIPPHIQDWLPPDRAKADRAATTARLKQLAGHDGVTVEVQTGHPARVILERARAEIWDCIVIGAHRPELRDHFLGSTAERVVRQAPCSVHVLR